MRVTPLQPPELRPPPALVAEIRRYVTAAHFTGPLFPPRDYPAEARALRRTHPLDPRLAVPGMWAGLDAGHPLTPCAG